MAKNYRNCLLDPEKDFLHLGFEIVLIEAPPTIERKNTSIIMITASLNKVKHPM